MMELRRRTLAVAMAATLWVIPTFTACATGTSGYEPPDVLAVRAGMSKVEVYERFGVPAAILHGHHTVLIYTKEIQRGMGLDLRIEKAPLQLLHIGHSHVGFAAVMIVIDENDRVIKTDDADYDELAQYKLWPWGS